MDCRQLKAGQNWDFEIKRALNKAALILVFISKNSVDRRGYVQREIRLALEKSEEKLVDDIYLIPVVLDDDVPISEQLAQIHILRASNPRCCLDLEDAIRHQSAKLGLSISEAQERSNVRWTATSHQESWDGLPGYEAEFQLLNFSSEKYPQVSQITDYLKGQFFASMMDQRIVKLYQRPEDLSFGQERFSRCNTWDASTGEPVVVGRILSIRYAIHWYACGAAHPNMHFNTYCFLLDPIVRLTSLEGVFGYSEQALAKIRQIVRRHLRMSLTEQNESEEDLSTFERDWIDEGTKNWESFNVFIFDLSKKRWPKAAFNYLDHVVLEKPSNCRIPKQVLIEETVVAVMFGFIANRVFFTNSEFRNCFTLIV